MEARSVGRFCVMLLIGVAILSPVVRSSLLAQALPGAQIPNRQTAQPRDKPTTAGQAPAAEQTLIDQRRAEVGELDAEWTRKLAEVEQHLADVAHAPTAEAEKAGDVYQRAKLAREVAEHRMNEYEQGVYKIEREAAVGEVDLADHEYNRTKDRLDFWEKLVAFKDKRGIQAKEDDPDDTKARSDHMTARLDLQKASLRKEQAASKLAVLDKYTKPMELKRNR